VLFYFHGMDVRAAAQSLSLPEGTIKARLSRGRAILLRKLSRLLARPEEQQEQKR
jgi:RNA polymerase sigma-70 factor (ECF subfamily)